MSIFMFLFSLSLACSDPTHARLVGVGGRVHSGRLVELLTAVSLRGELLSHLWASKEGSSIACIWVYSRFRIVGWHIRYYGSTLLSFRRNCAAALIHPHR